MTWSIVSDSSCDLRMSAFEGGCVRFETVPLRIQVGEQDFIDNEDATESHRKAPSEVNHP